jgi:uncharacterized protein YndB with AHSA1/START domain
MSDPNSTVVSRVIDAPREAVHRAYLDQDAVAAWLPPGSMRGVVHAFDGEKMGPSGCHSYIRKVTGRRGVRPLKAPTHSEAAMIVSTTLAPAGSGTKVTILCENIPRGIRHEDNEAGCRSTLEKLASFLDG